MLGEAAQAILDDYLAFIDRDLRRFIRDENYSAEFFLPDCLGAEAEAFRQKVRKAGAPPSRARLGVLRTYDPLVAWPVPRAYLIPHMPGKGSTAAARRSKRRVPQEDEAKLIQDEVKLIRVVRQGFKRELRFVFAELGALDNAMNAPSDQAIGH